MLPIKTMVISNTGNVSKVVISTVFYIFEKKVHSPIKSLLVGFKQL